MKVSRITKFGAKLQLFLGIIPNKLKILRNFAGDFQTSNLYVKEKARFCHFCRHVT